MNNEFMQEWNEQYEMACHNLLCYSKNYLMSESKAGYEKEWNEARNEANRLSLILNGVEIY